MNYCKVCGKKLELTPEYDMCMECQGKQHRTFTLPYIGGVNTNHTERTAKEALEYIKRIDNYLSVGQNIRYEIVEKALNKLEKIEGYVNTTDIIPELKIEIIKNIFKSCDIGGKR